MHSTSRLPLLVCDEFGCVSVGIHTLTTLSFRHINVWEERRRREMEIRHTSGMQARGVIVGNRPVPISPSGSSTAAASMAAYQGRPLPVQATPGMGGGEGGGYYTQVEQAPADNGYFYNRPAVKRRVVHPEHVPEIAGKSDLASASENDPHLHFRPLRPRSPATAPTSKRRTRPMGASLAVFNALCTRTGAL